MENRLLWDLHELLPGHVVVPRSLCRSKTLDQVAAPSLPLKAWCPTLRGAPGPDAGRDRAHQ